MRATVRGKSPGRKATAPEAPAEAQTVDLADLPNTLGYHLRRLHLVFMQGFARDTRDLEVTAAQFAALFVIAANPGITQTALGNALIMDGSRTVITIDELERRGLAERVTSLADRRSRNLFLTEAGRAMVAELRQRARRFDGAFMAELTAAEQDTLIRLLARLSAARS